MIYLDHNATEPTAPGVGAAVASALQDAWGNPSSPHRVGQSARASVELARASVAELVGRPPSDVILTSGGTESNGLAIAGRLAADPARRRIATLPTEHAAVRDAARTLAGRIDGAGVDWMPIDADGWLDPADLDRHLAEHAHETALVSIGWANNETGVIQDVNTCAEVCRKHGVVMHSDAVQWVGRMPYVVHDLDLMTISAHKFGGPKGVGALVARPGVRLMPAVVGGAQEMDRRGGTENVSGVAGAGTAARVRRERLAVADIDQLAARQAAFEARLVAAVPGARVNGATARRLWNTTSLHVPDLDVELAIMMLSERGIHVSAGAACSSGSREPSPVLLALGQDEAVTRCTLRLSAGLDTTEADLAAAADGLIEIFDVARMG
ncbi:MAG: cysteine desulfurase family protein [Phycisphaerales bacterium]